MCLMRRSQAEIRGQEKELFLFLSEAIRAIIRTVMNCLKQWERILITKVRQDGQHCKLANQIMIAGALSGVCEALTYAKEKGLDLNVFSKSVATGAAGSRQFDLFGPKIIEKDYAPGFFMKHFIKDMKLALIEANRSGLNLEVLSQVLAIYEELEADGNGDLGTQALIKYYE